VLAADRMVGREIVEGQLGCPVCEAVYPIQQGVVRFGSPTGEPPREATDVLQMAAMLDLAEPGGAVLLVGSWGVYAEPLAAAVDARFLVLDVPGQVPVAAQAVRAAATDFPAGVVRAVKAGGRIVAPAPASVPDGVTVLARDDRYWVGQVSAQTESFTRDVLALRRTRR
jgi:hypothetical protein